MKNFFKLPSFWSKKTDEVTEKTDVIITEFDCEIEITRMFDLIKDGWRIKILKDFEKFFNGTKIELLIGILGDKFSGKTFILQKILGEGLITDRDLKRKENKEKDEGMRSSLYFKEEKKNKIVYLDSLGSNLTPKSIYFFNKIKQIDENLDPIEKAKRKRDYETLAIVNELFIRNFVLDISSISLFVCPYLNGSILQRLNLIKSQFTQKVIIVHNIPSLGNVDDVDAYYNEILKPELNVEKCPIQNTNYYYYTTTELDNDKEVILVHVILGNDNIKEIKEYNNAIITYLKQHIQSKLRKEFDLKERLKHFCEAFARQYFDLKQKPNSAQDLQSVFLSDEIIDQLYKASQIVIKDNKISYQIVPEKQLNFYNLRFKNITLDFITGKEHSKVQLRITQYKIYYCGTNLYVQFYPLGGIKTDDIKVEIQSYGKIQKLTITGEYQNITKRMSKSLIEKEEVLSDSISRYKSFILEDYISKDYCILKQVTKKEKDENGEIKITIDIFLSNEQGEDQPIDVD